MSIVMAGLQPPETLTCNICFDNKPSMYFLTLQNCGHTFCIDCIRTVFEMNISQSRTNLECLYCTTEVSVSDVSLVVSELSFDKFLDFSLRRCLARTPDVRYCLAPDCPFACIMDKVSSRDDNHFVCRREQCGQEYCYECKSAWHPGKSCQQVKSEVAIDVVEGVAGTEIQTKQCPVCHVTVEKMADGSCNQVKCLSCGEDFCWLCGKKITEMHYLSPTGCPLYGSHQWSRRKLWCCRTGLWLLAPFIILLVALILIPVIIVLLPVGIGVLFYKVCVKKSRKGCKVFITLVAICATLPVAPIVALLVAVLFIPIALFYVYVIIPVHLVYTRCKSDGAQELDSQSPFCIEMRGQFTTLYKSGFGIKSPGKNTTAKQFTFDYSYWSVNESDDHYCGQEQVFSDLGEPVIRSAFEGYNACIFAYGQTGSGKTYTMMGSEDSPGLVPRFCEGLFARMANTQVPEGEELSFRTEVSYMEIYNEKVRDLLPEGSNKSSQLGLRVREHPTKGPYVEGVTKHAVNDYPGIARLLEHGNTNRATACTKMNDVSSRSHAIFTIIFTQAKYECDMPSETVSRLHLVDLAGSERASATGAEGERLKEGGNINRSLVCLGTVISTLAEASGHSGHHKKPFIPYRDSVLTWLLKDSLGGNSKTIMIATVSPAESSYGETLSTLRYASRAKKIVNKPTVNEDANVKLIRDLRAEIQRLKSKIAAGGQEPVDTSTEKLKSTKSISIAEDIYKKEEQVAVLTQEWAEKWKDIQRIVEERHVALHSEGMKMVVDSEQPHFVGVDPDILSTGLVFYYIKSGCTTIGANRGSSTTPDIAVNGNDVCTQHCKLECRGDRVLLHPLDGKCFVNHSKIRKPTKLSQGDLVQLGSSTVFRFNHPMEAHKMRKRHSEGLLCSSRYVVPQVGSAQKKRSNVHVTTEAESPVVTSAVSLAASESCLTVLQAQKGEKLMEWNCQPRTPLVPVQYHQEQSGIAPLHKQLSWWGWCKKLVLRLLLWMISPFLLLSLCVMTFPALSMLFVLLTTIKIFGFFQRFWITKWLAAALAMGTSIAVSPMVGFCDAVFRFLFSVLCSLRVIDIPEQ